LVSALRKVRRLPERVLLSIAKVAALAELQNLPSMQNMPAQVSRDHTAHLRSGLVMLAFQVHHSASAELALVAAAQSQTASAAKCAYLTSSKYKQTF
jgi:hypothetical protein